MRSKKEELKKGMATFGLFFGIFLLWFFIFIRSDAEEKSLIPYIEETCSIYNISPELVEAIIERESNWNADAVNGECVGLMQISQRYQKERMEKLGVNDLTDPEDNILVGVDYLAELFEEYDDPYAVLMFYNSGYSNEYGLRAYEDGRYSDYAKEVCERAITLELIHKKYEGEWDDEK